MIYSSLCRGVFRVLTPIGLALLPIAVSSALAQSGAPTGTSGPVLSWARQYAHVEGNGRGGNAEPAAIVVDELQNVYVTGKSYRIDTS